ncbi:MAG: cytochrome c [Calditrichia bacterium]
MVDNESNKIEVYLDDNPEPIAVYQPPGRFELDTSSLEDGSHLIRIVATDRYGHRGVRKIPFEVRNGPGIAVDGLGENDIVEGKISVLVNAYGGAYEEKWEPTRAETPAPIPTWAWVILIFISAWAIYYAVEQWKPSAQYADTPTYGKLPAAQQAGEEQSEQSMASTGAQLYRTSCASCHQNNGQGIPNTFPPLAGDPVVTAKDPTEQIRTVLFGKQGTTINGVTYSAQMPAWADQLSNKEIAAVINHERTSWGNNAPTVTPAQVAKIRKEGKSKQ